MDVYTPSSVGVGIVSVYASEINGSPYHKYLFNLKLPLENPTRMSSFAYNPIHNIHSPIN